MNKKARLIAFYLPQFHPIPENDHLWGKGFTEWTNVVQAKPLFKKHIQPKIPADLGFYDLRLEETRIAQATMAKDYGIEGFCYWHYWLGGGKRLLERPFNEVLQSGKPDFPFCLGWANHDWKGRGWMGGEENFLKQTYPGEQDAVDHFNYLVKAFKDKRYITVDGKPLLVIYKPDEIPDSYNYLNFWRELAKSAGLKGLHIVGDAPFMSRIPYTNYQKLGLDAIFFSGNRRIPSSAWDFPSPIEYLKYGRRLHKIKYSKMIKLLIKENGYKPNEYPLIVPNWDTTPRLQKEARIYYDYSPELFREHVKQILDAVSHRDYIDNLVFVRSWNEWAEGNYLEPDQTFGLKMLEVLKEEIFI